MKTLFASAAICGFGMATPVLASSVDVVLHLQERIPMATLAQDVSDPASLRFRKFYTPEEIRQLAGPSDTEYQALVQHLQSKGMTVVSESPTHLMLTVRGEQAAFETHFQVRVEALDATTRALRGSVVLPDAMRLVAGVSGLDNTRRSRSRVRRPLAGGPSPDGISLATIRTLYGFDALYAKGVTGKGQHIAIATYDDFVAKDVTDYYKNNGVSPSPTVDKVVFNGAPQVNLQSSVETELDAEFSGALAPGAAVHVFSSSTNDDAGEQQMFTAILDDNRAKVVNYSWGGCEADLVAAHKTAMDALFNRAVAQGVNILNASGDSGSSCQIADGTTPDPMADWPAAHPSVVAVGGTTLDTTVDTLSETAWNSSGGGISTIWALPAFQAAFKAPFVKRSYPDVAFNGNPASGQAAWVNDQGTGVEYLVLGGTSIASPQWAGFLTLVGEARAASGKAPLGFLNPIIYGLSDADRAASFDDVTSGSNGTYSCTVGWDAVTGWGGPRAAGLFAVLTRN